ncbi:MAG: hypothetical protein J5744_01475 [Oscillospiraceae bacterium]|nr:hypothetical protein [Oscillospiraceae bacterium]
MKYYIRYREDLKWEEINRTQAAKWLMDDRRSNETILSMLAKPNYIRSNGVEIKVVGDNGEQPDERMPYTDRYYRNDWQEEMERLTDKLIGVFRNGDQVIWKALGFMIRLYFIALQLIFRIMKKIFRAIMEVIEEERYMYADNR